MADEPDDGAPADDSAGDTEASDDPDVTRAEPADRSPVGPDVTDVDGEPDGSAAAEEPDGAGSGTADTDGPEDDTETGDRDDEAGGTGGQDESDEEGDGGVPYVAPDDADAVSEADDEAGDADDDADGGGPSVPDGEEPGLPEDVDAETGMLSGPATDEEQPIAVHVEEMVKRLGVVILVAGIVSALCFPLGDDLISNIWYGVLPTGTTAQPHVYGPLELIVTQFKVASIAGVVVALPVLVYETYAFMRPGLYPNERRYYISAIPTSLVLAVVGVTFAYFIVVPAVMTYFLFYSETVATAALALGSTFNLILILMAYLAIVFQIPLFVMLAIMMGLTTRRWLADRRLLFWGAFAGVSFLMTPDPTGVAPVVVAVTMIVLFEGTLLLLKWTGN
ncbi:twin-arginine translocase subunit TatC [Halarchaeum sp. CBA1220]|uniref:twin-arginine translocase subunit TatC n=1 Tax=Halarchaeum sp. CBA1220 TaxID=1853682 RepID=UPI0015A3BD55|nr:twin-arginine translocase subunit TatC [Halarchaeum sp. CBA1220]QLC33325.1 twin-arginine translocase subunit TatC [Halarchaeum sp. CBA1220]